MPLSIPARVALLGLAIVALVVAIGSPRADAVLVVQVLVALAGAGLLLRYSARAIGEPLTGIERWIRGVARGEEGSNPPVVQSRDLERLVSSLDQLVRAREAARQRSKADTEVVLGSMAEGVMVVDGEGRIVMWNDAFRNLFPDVAPEGRLPIEVVRSSILREAMAETALARVARSVELTAAPGSVLSAKLAPLPDRAAGMVVVFHDISALKRSEQLLRDFVAHASHELRTPIATIRAAVETLESMGIATDQALQFIHMIGRQSERMAKLVSDMLRLSELESSYEPDRQPFELAPLVQELLAAARARLGETGPRFLHEIAAVEVVADATAVAQMLTNLVDNACKHTPASGTITIRGYARGGQSILEVADTGSGISREHLARLFDRFYRVDRGRSRDDGGTGLGLAIVRQLARAHGGDVEVESELGKGTTFRIRLP